MPEYTPLAAGWTEALGAARTMLTRPGSAPHRWAGASALGSVALVALVVVAVFKSAPTPLSGASLSSAFARGRSSITLSAGADGRCAGFDKCPKYPEPYKQKEWPTEYVYAGAFPEHFVWGVGTASYQIEGAYREGGRGASIWDTFSGADTVGMPGAVCSYCCKTAPCPTHQGMWAKGATGNVACDHYHTYKSDIALMKSMGLKHYRFSIAWPRLIPTGRKADGVNAEAVAFYNGLIDALIAAGITPYVTLYHWDLPQGLMDPPRVNGWWSRDADGVPNGEILEDWLDYADTCFKTFGDRVKTWITFNEAFTFTFFGSGLGKAPSHPDYSDLTVDPYVAGHNVLNAHAAAVDLYRRKYQKAQKGEIGITNNCDWHEPLTDDPDDVAAAERANLFQLGWFSEPIFGGKGDYPAPMRKLYGDKLPRFTKKQRRLINGSADFYGLNHYATSWTSYDPDHSNNHLHAKFSEEGLPRGQSVWIYGAAWGFRKMLNWVERRYPRQPIYVTESGWSLEAHAADDAAPDAQRVSYFANYTSEMHKAITEDGIDIRGYFAWSLMDNYEWERGYVERFGVTYTDFNFGMDKFAPAENFMEQPQTGHPARRRKDSSCWLEAVWRSNKLTPPEEGRCASSAVMNGSYTDSRHPGCARQVTFYDHGRTGHIFGTGDRDGTDCSGPSVAHWGPLPVAFSGSTIIADFTSRGGQKHLAGYWNRARHAIEWGDGSTWVAKDSSASGISFRKL